MSGPERSALPPTLTSRPDTLRSALGALTLTSGSGTSAFPLRLKSTAASAFGALPPKPNPNPFFLPPKPNLIPPPPPISGPERSALPPTLTSLRSPLGALTLTSGSGTSALPLRLRSTSASALGALALPPKPNPNPFFFFFFLESSLLDELPDFDFFFFPPKPKPNPPPPSTSGPERSALPPTLTSGPEPPRSALGAFTF